MRHLTVSWGPSLGSHCEKFAKKSFKATESKSFRRPTGIGAGSDSQLRYHADVLMLFDALLRLEPDRRGEATG